MRIPPRVKEYLTVGRTLEELVRQEPEIRAAGFRKWNRHHGQSSYTGEFYQWWIRTGSRNPNRWHGTGRCVRCGEKVARSARGKSQWCKPHLEAYREYAKVYYHKKLKPKRQKEVGEYALIPSAGPSR